MDRHLDSGCKVCGEVAGMWRRVFELAQKDREVRPPDGSVRFAKGYFALSRSQPELSRATRVAQLIFDTFRQPMPEGVRSSQAAARHLVYRAGALMVDVRFEAGGQKAQPFLAGQVIDGSSPDRTIKDVAVSIRRGMQDLAHTTTNEFGEFQFELGSLGRKDPELVLWVEAKDSILIPLGVIDPGEPTG